MMKKKNPCILHLQLLQFQYLLNAYRFYWAITVTIAMIIGVFTGIVFNFDPRLSLLAGYAGTDILEGIYKSFKTEKVLVVTAKK